MVQTESSNFGDAANAAALKLLHQLMVTKQEIDRIKKLLLLGLSENPELYEEVENDGS